MRTWNDITFCLRQFGAFLPHSNPMPGLVLGNTYGDNLGIDQLLQSHPLDLQTGTSTNTLSSLSEFSFLETPTTPPTLDTYQYTNPSTWPWDQSESPGMGVLQVSFHQRDSRKEGRLLIALSQHGLQMMMNTSEPSLPNVGGGVSFVDNNPLTVNLATISPPPVGADLFKDEDLTTSASSESESCGLSLDFDFDFASDDAVSPSSFSQSPGAQQDSSFDLSFSSRRHSVSASERTVGLKTKRNNQGDDSYFPQLPVGVDHFAAAAAAAAPSKRRRAVGGDAIIVKATSAPARFTVPLPPIEVDDRSDDGSTISSVSSQQSQLPTPVTPTPPAAAPPGNNNKGRRRVKGARRTKCEYCPKTFTRMQDAQRHAERSCRDNPSRTGVLCPECGEVLSRLDSAQRHWRGHENPQCEPPEWAHSRM
jgi:hypothetical protein